MIILGWRLRVPPFRETPNILTYEGVHPKHKKKTKTPFWPQDEVSYARNVSFIDDDLDEGEIGQTKPHGWWLIDAEGLPVGIEEQLESRMTDSWEVLFSKNLDFQLHFVNKLCINSHVSCYSSCT